MIYFTGIQEQIIEQALLLICITGLLTECTKGPPFTNALGKRNTDHSHTTRMVSSNLTIYHSSKGDWLTIRQTGNPVLHTTTLRFNHNATLFLSRNCKCKQCPLISKCKYQQNVKTFSDHVLSIPQEVNDPMLQKCMANDHISWFIFFKRVTCRDGHEFKKWWNLHKLTSFVIRGFS